MLPRSLLLLAPSLSLMIACPSPDQTLSVEKTPTPGEETERPPTPTPEPIAVIRIEPDEVDFGSQGIGCRISKNITIHNDGTGALSVYSAALSIASSVDFEIPNGDLLTVPPLSSSPLEIVYEVAGAGEDTGTLLIQSNDQEAGTVTVALKGVASENIPFDQQFIQQPGGPVDILLAIDVSSYATEYVGGLPANIDYLFELLKAAGVEWHMAWLATDPVDGAAFHGTYGDDERTYITWEDEQEVLDAFKTNIVQRIAKPATTYTPGLQIINAAFSEENLAGPNQGFLRDEATLSILVSSVYDDDSQDATRLLVPVVDLAEDLTAVKGSADQIRFDAIVGERTGSCAREMGQRYIQMSQIFGGFTEDICFQIWDSTFEVYNRAVQQLQTDFVLDETPEDPSELMVTVDDVEVERDADNGWVYNSELNAVTFTGDAIPAPGAVVDISFERGGECHE